jgi:membrane-bound ClpP family serine protease
MEYVARITGFDRSATLRHALLLAALLLGVSLMGSALLADERPAAVKADVASGTGTERAAPSQWLDRIAEFFRYPIVKIALITLGFIGLIFEFKLPGSTFPGSVAAVCFVLFFWAHSFVGQFTLLAILLFMLGLVFLGIEIFVVPGLCFSGVAGAGLLFISLLLVTLHHWPSDAEEWKNLGTTFGSLAIAMGLAAAGALALTWSLPNIPLLNRMVLTPPTEEEEMLSATGLSNSGLAQLLGAIGVAVTPLRPAGKAQFGEQFMDVMAEGDYVAPGCRVQVIEVEGNRMVVKEV